MTSKGQKYLTGIENHTKSNKNFGLFWDSFLGGVTGVIRVHSSDVIVERVWQITDAKYKK